MRVLYAFRHERWEQLCYRAYASVSQTQLLALREANRNQTSLMADFRFQGGELVVIPNVEVEAVLQDTMEKPPWAR